MSTALTTTAKVKAYLGITVSTYDTVIGNIVDAVNNSIELYCGRTFGRATFADIQFGSEFLRLPYFPDANSSENAWNSVNYPTIAREGERVVLDNTPINAVLYAAYGMQSVCNIQYDGNAAASIEVVASNKVILIENLTQTEITFDSSWSVLDVINAIDAETNWTASSGDSNYDTYPAKSILQRYSGPVGPQGALGSIQLLAAVNRLNMSRDVDGLYRANAKIGSNTTMLIIYDGGYDDGEWPAALTEIATKAAADAFSGISKEAGLKKEKIGDYSYEKFESAGYSYVGPYEAQLDMFRRVPMGVS